MEKKKNSNLTAAKKNKQDEFYTRLYDIENELKYYKDQFKDKVVYCNCDNPGRSEFVRFFRLKFVDYGLKKLIATCITEDKSTGWAYVWDKDINGNGILDEDEVQMFPLKQNGDFRSDECIEYLKESDIVVTNPPFSLFREFVATIVKYNKKFLILGNNNAVTYKEIFPLLKDGKMRLGHAYNKTMEFEVPDGYKFSREENGKKFGKVPAITWFTNLLVHKADNPMELTEKYDPKKHLKYDNYDAINCDKIVDIPYDYDGVIGVPITITGLIADDGYIHFTHTGIDGNAQNFTGEMVWTTDRGGDNNLEDIKLTHTRYDAPVVQGGKYKRILIRLAKSSN